MAEMEKDIVTLRLFPENRAELQMKIEIGTSSIIGTRHSQEDTIFGYGSGKEAIALVCDGMGGLSGGEIASKAAAESLIDAWFGRKEIVDIPEFLEKEALKADERVFQQKNDKGERLRAGTTIVAAIIRGNELYWLSVGDSKIYIIRGEEILSVCREHNYRLTLNRQLEQGELTPEEYAAEEYRAEALISYLGMGNVSLMDLNRQPFCLENGDIVLLSSDGLYRSLAEEEILCLIKEFGGNMQETADVLTSAALGNKQSGQDNTSVVLMRYSLQDKKEEKKRMGGKKDEFKKM
ncbi:serine/threonine-protein phosphatase [Petralouisia muris]|uniref:Serine/threonine-protein phosphatase n=1 Tax=Petralouisia muris TaxID=3032872 RepID=A0AC61S039_9FIRM|nr:protein phosphatase 2C domain-containing protein [Petralouisia muris]TGY97783.1 serine/threonine-protein phosphatase [Petralouisia muris]